MKIMRKVACLRKNGAPKAAIQKLIDSKTVIPGLRNKSKLFSDSNNEYDQDIPGWNSLAGLGHYVQNIYDYVSEQYYDASRGLIRLILVGEPETVADDLGGDASGTFFFHLYDHTAENTADNHNNNVFNDIESEAIQAQISEVNKILPELLKDPDPLRNPQGIHTLGFLYPNDLIGNLPIEKALQGKGFGLTSWVLENGMSLRAYAFYSSLVSLVEDGGTLWMEDTPMGAAIDSI